MKSTTAPRRMLILILAIVITVIAPLQASAAPRNQYVGDLYLAYGKNAESAKKALPPRTQLQYLDNIYGGIAEIIAADMASIRDQLTAYEASGLTGNIHIVGEKGAVNIASGSFRNYSTFQKTRNLISDKTLYTFYGISDTPKTYDESAGNMTATHLSGGTAALFGFGGMAIGAVLGAVIANLMRRRRVSYRS